MEVQTKIEQVCRQVSEDGRDVVPEAEFAREEVEEFPLDDPGAVLASSSCVTVQAIDAIGIANTNKKKSCRLSSALLLSHRHFVRCLERCI